MADRFFGRFIISAILALGYYQAAIGLIQWLGFAASHHPGYAFTGTFYNPGPYACFLAVALPAALWAMLRDSHRIERWAGAGYVLLCALLIPATLSRTALAACGIGGAVALWPLIHPRIGKTPKSRIVMTGAAVLVGVACLYVVKKDSADGRLLMWKVASEAVTAAPAAGVGWDNVAGAYGEAQERYFASEEASEQDRMVADAPEYVFCEYLQVAIAFGPVAAIAMISVIIGATAIALRRRSYGLAGCSAAVSAVMTASYPLQFPIFVIMICAVLAGCYLSARLIWLKIAGVVIVAGGAALFLAHNHKTNTEIEFRVGHTLHRQGEYRKSNVCLMELKKHSSDPMILNVIGKNYRALQMPDSARYYLKKSALRCPNRMYPHYLLMNLYNDSASPDTSACRREAEIIMRMRVKIPSEATEEMRRKANEVISNSE